MRRRMIAMAVLALPFSAPALTPPPEAQAWHRCTADEDCVLLEGICGPTGVNRAYRTFADEYYKKARKKANCKQEFWRPKANAVRCRIEACEAVVD